MGIILLTLWITVLVLSLVCPILMSPDSWGPNPVFYTFGGLSTIGAFYCYIVLKETKGLSDKEKKSLFLPKSFKIAQNVYGQTTNTDLSDGVSSDQ